MMPIVVQGAVEKSNVEPIVEMTRLVKLQRSYEYVQQMIDQEHDRTFSTRLLLMRSWRNFYRGIKI